MSSPALHKRQMPDPKTLVERLRNASGMAIEDAFTELDDLGREAADRIEYLESVAGRIGAAHNPIDKIRRKPGDDAT